MDDAVKSALTSKGVWGGLVAIVAAAAAGIWHVSISPDDQMAIVNILVSLVTMGGGALAIYGRIKASKKIG